MKVEIWQDAHLLSPEITMRCPVIDEDILRIMAMLRVRKQKITGILEGDSYLLDGGSWIDVYTPRGTALRLYYRYDAIPEDWLAPLQRREWIEELCESK